MGKTIEFKIPEGYVMDKDNSTKEKIIFKLQEKDTNIRWSENYNGCIVEAEGESFLISNSPSYFCSYYTAKKLEGTLDVLSMSLPTTAQLKTIAKHFNAINDAINNNNGYAFDEGLYISSELKGEKPICVGVQLGNVKCYPPTVHMLVRYVTNFKD